jgi:hypothetical protein
MAAPIPDFSGALNRASLNGLEPPLSGHQSSEEQIAPADRTTTRHMRVDRRLHQSDLAAWAAEVVKKFGEISLAGKGCVDANYGLPADHSWRTRARARFCRGMGPDPATSEAMKDGDIFDDEPLR